MPKEVIRIFIGTEPKTRVFARVLEHSIRRHCKRPVEVTYMEGTAWEYDHTGVPVGTGFSLRRWMIPAACDWLGKAIYLDADQLVFADVGELWDLAEPRSDGPAAWCSYQPDKFSTDPWPQTSVMVLDCAAARPNWGFSIGRVLEYLKAHPTKHAYADFMHATWLHPKPVPIPAHWNALNVYEKGKTKLLHYTKEPEQPHYKPDHPLAGLWQDALARAIRAGAVPKSEFEFGLDQWRKVEDWRKTNGIHPFYRKFLGEFPK